MNAHAELLTAEPPVSQADKAEQLAALLYELRLNLARASQLAMDTRQLRIAFRVQTAKEKICEAITIHEL